MWKVNDSLLILLELFTIIVLSIFVNILDIFEHFNVNIPFITFYWTFFLKQAKPFLHSSKIQKRFSSDWVIEYLVVRVKYHITF